jgi:hypothetical protein
MWLLRGLVTSTLILAAKAQNDIDDAAIQIAQGFAETLIQHAVTTLSGNAGGAASGADSGKIFDSTQLNKSATEAVGSANYIPITQQHNA